MIKKYISYLVIIIIGLFIDQYSKYLCAKHLKPIGKYNLIDGIFRLNYRENSGAAFSILENQMIFFFIMTFIVMGILFFLIISGRVKSDIATYAIIFIITGGLGNFIDRFRNGFVVDMFDFYLINFAVFNVADIFITCGSVIFIITFLFSKNDVIVLKN